MRTLILCSLFLVGCDHDATGRNDTIQAPEGDLAGHMLDLAGPTVDGAMPPAPADMAMLATAPPDAPLIDGMKGISGGVQVKWYEMTAPVDACELWRKDGLTSYAVIATPDGAVTQYEDMTAKQTFANYTYRVRCQKGGTWSDYSNEESAMPLP